MTSLTGSTPLVSPLKRNGNDQESGITGKKLVIHLKHMIQLKVSSSFSSRQRTSYFVWNTGKYIHGSINVKPLTVKYGKFMTSLSSSLTTTILFHNFELLFIHCTNVTA